MSNNIGGVCRYYPGKFTRKEEYSFKRCQTLIRDVFFMTFSSSRSIALNIVTGTACFHSTERVCLRRGWRDRRGWSARAHHPLSYLHCRPFVLVCLAVPHGVSEQERFWESLDAETEPLFLRLDILSLPHDMKRGGGHIPLAEAKWHTPSRVQTLECSSGPWLRYINK